MSRSTKKPIYTDQQQGRKSASAPSSSTFQKRKANRKIRAANKKVIEGVETEEVSAGSAFRKFYESWNIRDWTFWSPKDKKAYRK